MSWGLTQEGSYFQQKLHILKSDTMSLVSGRIKLEHNNTYIPNKKSIWGYVIKFVGGYMVVVLNIHKA